MSERLFARLADALAAGEPTVLASILETQGAVPRRAGSRLLAWREGFTGSVGGGEAEARVLAAARALLEADQARGEVAIDLTGRPGAAGICGGRMQVALRRWDPVADLARAEAIRQQLHAGRSVQLAANDVGAGAADVSQCVQPDPRLLIAGAGHCGEALHRLARELDFEVWVHDARAECFGDARFAGATVLCGSAALLARALATPRTVFAVLLNRDFAADVAVLDALAPAPPAFVGMMGSLRRIAQVRASLPQHAALLARVHAPVGLDIDAQTPEEIAVSILAQLVAVRRGLPATD